MLRLPRLMALACLLATLSGTARAEQVLEIPIVGPVGAATGELVAQGIAEAEERHAPVVVLRLDTPGGLDSAMRRIVQAILGSRVPIVGYVAPPGARAASAGTYILYASHIAAMAPATNLGAATPVEIGGLPGVGKGGDGKESTTMERKMVSDATAYIRGLADLRGRNAQWAERAVRESASLSAQGALKAHVIDLVAEDVPGLLAAIDGLRVRTAAGEAVLHTRGVPIREVEPGWRLRLLSTLANPEVAYLLLLVGIYGIAFELLSPGAVLPGVVGAVSLLLALYSFQLLPIDYAGLGLILLGIGLMAAEVFVPSFGALGLGGLVAFLFGSIVLMDEDGLHVALPLALTTGVLSAGFSIWVLGRLVRLRRRKSVIGLQGLVGQIAEARSDFEREGWVHIGGELWQAVSSVPVRNGQLLRVVEVRGLKLSVEPEQPMRDEPSESTRKSAT